MDRFPKLLKKNSDIQTFINDMRAAFESDGSVEFLDKPKSDKCTELSLFDYLNFRYCSILERQYNLTQKSFPIRCIGNVLSR